MPQRPSSSRTRRLAALGVLCLALACGGGGPAAGAPPVTTGEDDAREIGPRTAPVDPAFATHEAARGAVAELHRRHPQGPGSSDLMAADSLTATAALDPAVYGQWETLSYQLPVRAVHVTALKTGKFLLIAGSGNVSSENVLGNFKAYLWDPATGALTSVPVPYDAFCSGHLVDANGDVIVFGGTVKYKTATTGWVGSNKVYKFVVASSTWVAMPSMKVGRWYPTNLMDGKKRFFSYAGRDANGAITTAPEMFDPVTNAWSTIAGRTLPLYPGLLMTSNGRMYYSGAHYGDANGTVTPKVFDPITGSSVSVSGSMDLSHRNAAMAALVGSADQQLAWVAGGGFPAVRSTYFTKLNATTPAATAGPDLATAKAYVSISGLPDLTALETGGGTGTDTPVYEASILDPTSRTLTTVAPPSVPRTYHSSSLTTADGRVITFGGDPSGDATFELRVEVYSPPYLFKGTRPTITSAPTEVRYGSTYTVGATASGTTVSYASLLRPGSATHSLDANQRGLKLATTPVTGGVQVTLPTSTNLLTPGWYTLSVVDGLGRPAVSRWVHLS